MKGFLISLSLLLSVSISARELTFSERSMLINYKKINHVKSHMLSKIIVDDLSLGEFLSYKVLQNSCKPLDDILNMKSKLKKLNPDNDKDNYSKIYGNK